MTVAPTEPSEGTDLDPDLAVGTMVGEYRVEGKLGQGGFGAVFKASHPLIGKQVAIKVLSTRFSADREMVSRFISEAKAVNQIRHRHIIDIFSFGQLEDRRWYYVMEYVEGEPLDRRIRREGLSLVEAVPILRAVAKALDAAHAKGIAHRDLKAENIFLGTDTDGAVFPKLLDFGIAKLSAANEGVVHKTQTGAPMGTPYYMSPEQTRGRNVDHRTDLYAFGVLIYVMLTRKYPLDGDDFMSILMRQVTDEPEPASTHVPDLPDKVDQVIAWLMRKDPAERPPDLMTAVRALEDVVGIAPPGAPSEPIAIPLHVTPTRLPTAPTAAATTLGAGAGAAATMPATVPANAVTKLEAPPARRTALWLGLGVVAITGVVVAFIVTRSTGSPVAAVPDARSITPDAAVVAVEPDAAAVAVEPDAAAAPRFVTITIEGAPAGAEVTVAGRLFGTVPKVQIPHGDAEVQLVVSADGYHSTTVPFVPRADGKHTVKLKPRHRAVRPGSNAPGVKLTDDIMEGPDTP